MLSGRGRSNSHSGADAGHPMLDHVPPERDRDDEPGLIAAAAPRISYRSPYGIRESVVRIFLPTASSVACPRTLM